ncbi:MAG TPA: ThiF family adenylyltransferase [Solirubrobacteraceae bacterium]|nr:ThiF family adenylyltransferase [Solirubrobacteraceae bacterium]
MADGPLTELRIPAGDYERLHAHLFPGDRDEHGAILLAGEHHTDTRTTLAVRETHLLDPHEFPPGTHGYRQFAPGALARLGNRAAQERLALVTVHSHPGAGERNSLSRDDLVAHERVFPHLLDITDAASVTGVALGEASAAGESWHTNGSRRELAHVKVLGANVWTLRPSPPKHHRGDLERFDRQVLLFGAAGQARLRGLHVGVLGAGGGGSILIEQLAHLGVGQITTVDPDIVKRHNLSRIIGASERDARNKRKKVHVARDHVQRIDPSIRFNAIDGDISHSHVAEQLLDCDYLLLATDTATARLVANAIAQSFLIPLIQIGAKVELRSNGDIEQIYTAVRPVLPRHGCLSCAGLIDPILLQREAATPEQRAQQNYLGQEDIADPSVTTLNAAAAAGALNVLLMSVIGQADEHLAEHRITITREGRILTTTPKRDPDCRWCGNGESSRYARADTSLLPLRPTAPVSAKSSLARRLIAALARR